MGNVQRTGGLRGSWKVRDKSGLLLALMEELAGDAHISFEGDLQGLALKSVQGASEHETSALKRNTIWPKEDFVVLPLEPAKGKAILLALGGNVPRAVIHIQIEKANTLAFGAYDNFDPNCIFFGSAVPMALLEKLEADGVLGAGGGEKESAVNTLAGFTMQAVAL
jgi:hypothetical protein